jgi:diaminopimelate decarboxylase
MDNIEHYEPPSVEPLGLSTVVKHTLHDVLPPSGQSFALDLEALVSEYGSPLFVASENVLRESYRGFARAFSSPDFDTRIAYSYKTNYLPAICRVFHEEGAFAEVVSGMEYDLARALSVPGDRIVFNGPFKRRDEIERAIGERALINIDGFDELDLVTRVAAGLSCPARIGLRINFRYGKQSWNKFGFNFENGDSRRALERIAGEKSLALEALHNHSGTFLLKPEIYGRAADVLIDSAKQARELGLKPTTLDLGGGFPSDNDLKPQITGTLGVGMLSKQLSGFAAIIAPRIKRARALFGGRPTLILEPGRALVDNAVHLVATVIAEKTVPEKGPAVVIDAGVNLLPTVYWYDHRVTRAPTAASGASDGRVRPISIYGPLCMQIDVLRENVLMKPPKIGELLTFSNVGAYCQTQSMQFIQPRPATVLVSDRGVDLIRKKETWRDIFILDQIPERLKGDSREF